MGLEHFWKWSTLFSSTIQTKNQSRSHGTCMVQHDRSGVSLLLMPVNRQRNLAWIHTLNAELLQNHFTEIVTEEELLGLQLHYFHTQMTFLKHTQGSLFTDPWNALLPNSILFMCFQQVSNNLNNSCQSNQYKRPVFPSSTISANAGRFDTTLSPLVIA